MNRALLRLSYFAILYGLLTISHAMDRDEQPSASITSPATITMQIAEK